MVCFRVSKSITVLGCGFIGAGIALSAARTGWTVRVLSRSDPFDVARMSGIELRHGSTDTAKEILAVSQGSSVVVLALGGLFPAASIAHPVRDLETSTPTIVRVCESIVESGERPRVFFMSSAGSIYEPSDTAIAEAAAPLPTSPYGVSRLACESYMRYYARHHGLQSTSVRVAYAYGWLLPRDRGQNLPSAATWAARRGDQLPLYGGGHQVRDFVHIDDLASAVMGLAGCIETLPPVLNLGSGSGSSVLEVVAAVEQATGRSVAVREVPAVGPKDLGQLVLDTSLLRNTTSFEPRSLAEGIAHMVHSEQAERVAALA